MEALKNRNKQEMENKNENQLIIYKSKKKKILLDIIQNNLIFIIGILLLVYKGLLLNYQINLEIGIETVKYTICVTLLIMCPLINNKNKFSYIYLNIIYTIVTLIIYANFLYYTYATNFLSFYQIVNLKYSKEIASGVFTIINIKSIFYFG